MMILLAPGRGLNTPCYLSLEILNNIDFLYGYIQCKLTSEYSEYIGDMTK